MFEQYGTDHNLPALNLNSMLPSVNQSEASYSLLGTTFQRWLTKPEVTNVAGTIYSFRTPIADAIEELVPARQQQQLVPVFTYESGSTTVVKDWNDVLKKLEFGGVDLSRYSNWGAAEVVQFNPPITLDKLHNWEDYYWVGEAADSVPDYITIVRGAANPWGRANRWKHFRELTNAEYQRAIRASLPIIEYHDLEMNEWVKVSRVWRKYDPNAGVFRATSAQPTTAEILHSSFTDLWELVSETTTPCENQQLADITAAPGSAQAAFSTNPNLVPPYVMHSNSIRVYFVMGTVWERRYDFVEMSPTSIQLLSTVPAGAQLRIYVGSALASEYQLGRVPTRTTTGVVFKNLSSRFHVGQQKTAFNQQPIFNLYNVDGSFSSTGYVWRFKSDSSLDIVPELQQRISIANSYVDVQFQTDLYDSAADVLKVFKTTAGVSSTIWSGVDQIVPTRDGTDPDAPWQVPAWVQYNPNRETRVEYKLSELTRHVDARVDGGYTIAVGHDSMNILVSTMLADDLSVPNLLDFVATQRKAVIQQIHTNFGEELVGVLTNNSNATVADIPSLVYSQLKQRNAQVGEQSAPFIDTGSQSASGIGYPNTVLTFGQMGLLGVMAPAAPYVDSFGQLLIPTHEHINGTPIVIPVEISQQTVGLIERAIVANAGVVVSTVPPIPSSPNAYWRNMFGVLYKLEVDVFDTNAPFSPTEGLTWFNPSTAQYSIWSSGAWVNTTPISNWREINVKIMLAATLVAFEHDLYERAIELGSPVVDVASVVLANATAHTTLVDRALHKHVELLRRATPTINVSRETQHWLSSIDRAAAHLISAYQVSPIQFLNAVIDVDSVFINGTRINKRTQNLHKNTQQLHGEIGWTDSSLLQALVVYARYAKLNNRSTSPLDTFKRWTTKLGYRTGAIVVPQTLRVRSNCEAIDEFDVVLKKTENVRQLAFSNVIVTLHAAGSGNDLPYGDGDGWTFKLDSSGPRFFDNHMYGLRQQSVQWLSQYSVFRVADGAPIKWKTGDAVNFTEQYGPTAPTTTLFVRLIPNTAYFQLVDGAERAVDIASGFVNYTGYTLPTTAVLREVESTFTTTSQYGARTWTTTAPDRSEVVTFDFPVIVSGIDGIIDFMQGYVPYLEDQGVVFNDGERPVVDPNSGEMLSWRQQLIRAIGVLYSSAGLTNRDYRGVGQYTDRLVFTDQFVEMNPFPSAIWFNTRDGVLCDFNNTPYVAESRSTTALFDQLGQPIVDYMTPLRSDCITSVFYTPPVASYNPQEFPLGEQHIGSGCVSIDAYEHYIVFGSTTREGYTIYDGVLNLSKDSLDIEMQRSTVHKSRPVLPGYVVTSTDTLPNFETIANHQRNDFNAVMSNELVQTTQDVRRMLGKTPQGYFDSIPVTSKTEFNFWKRMIRQKGTADSIQHLGKHSAFDATTMDEFWAWKLGTFGGHINRKQYEFVVTRDMVGRDNACISFMPELPSTVVSDFPIVQLRPTDDRLWRDYPSFVDTLGSDSYVRIPNIRRISNVLTQTPDGTLSGVESLPTEADSAGIRISHTSSSSAVEFVLAVYNSYQSESIAVDAATLSVRTDFTEQLLETADAILVYVNDRYTTAFRRRGHWFEFDTTLNAADVVDIHVVQHPVKLTQTLTQPFGAVKQAEHATKYTKLEWTRSVSWRNPVTNFVSRMDYEVVNNSVIRILDMTIEQKFCTLSIVEVLPDYAQFSPMRLADLTTSQILQPFPAWDPASGVHSNAIGQVDVMSPVNPAVFGADKVRETDAAMWSEPQLGQYWWDTSNIRYKPYADEARYGFDDGSNSWGALYDGVEPNVYVWAKRSTPPSNSASPTGEQCYSRLLKKTRASVQFVVASNDDLTATVFLATNEVGSAFVDLVDGTSVAVYCTSPLASEYTATGVNLGVEYQLVVVSAANKTFKLKSIDGDGSYARSVVLNSISTSAKFYIADVDWGNYPFEVMLPAHQRWFVCNNRHANAALDQRRDFKITNPEMLSREYLEQFLTVWVNGSLAVHSYDDATKIINVVDPTSLQPLYLTDNDEVFVECSLPEPNVVGNPPVSSSALTILVEDIPYTKITTSGGNSSITEYYFWVRNVTNMIPPGKTLSVGEVARRLKYPQDGGFMCARAARYSSTELEYTTVQIRGLVNTKYPETKSICVDFDQAIRDKYRDPNQKNVHEQWTLIREHQLSTVPYTIWKKVMEAMLGFEVAAYERSIGSVQLVKNLLPTATRNVYDYFNGTNTRYGSAPTQVLLERNEARELLIEIMTDPTINTRPSSVDLLLETNLDDDEALYATLVELYTAASSVAVNKLTFAIIKAGLFRGYNYADVFKTSYVYLESTHQVN